ncbi:hypothetical protein, partial [Candidatus Accumulibacter cognatus]|uniref:hypothetical protein n=1 Tax=Candidatus Accumulibacter cognatus TaxID=2954383 RepID=UPI00235B6E87
YLFQYTSAASFTSPASIIAAVAELTAACTGSRSSRAQIVSEVSPGSSKLDDAWRAVVAFGFSPETGQNLM